MDNVYDFFESCAKPNVEDVERLISEGVDINGFDKGDVNVDPATGLMAAMSNDNTEVVRILLSCNNIKIDIQDIIGYTALHYACLKNSIESVKMFLAHPACNKNIVEIKNMYGDTAEMLAEGEDHQECARLIREFTASIAEDKKFIDVKMENNHEVKLENLTMTEVARRIEDMDANEIVIKAKIKNELKVELDKLENEYKRTREAAIEWHEDKNKKFCSENEMNKKALHQELEKRLASSAAGAPWSRWSGC